MVLREIAWIKMNRAVADWTETISFKLSRIGSYRMFSDIRRFLKSHNLLIWNFRIWTIFWFLRSFDWNLVLLNKEQWKWINQCFRSVLWSNAIRTAVVRLYIWGRTKPNTNWSKWVRNVTIQKNNTQNRSWMIKVCR